MDKERYYLGKEDEMKRKNRMETLKKEFKDLKRSMKEDKKTSEEEKVKLASEAEQLKDKKLTQNSIIEGFLSEQEKYKERKKESKKGGDRESETLAMLAKFKSKIESAKSTYTESIQDSAESPTDETESQDEDMSW